MATSDDYEDYYGEIAPTPHEIVVALVLASRDESWDAIEDIVYHLQKFYGAVTEQEVQAVRVEHIRRNPQLLFKTVTPAEA